MSGICEIEEVPEDEPECAEEETEEEQRPRKMEEREAAQVDEERERAENAQRWTAEAARELRERLLANQLEEVRIERRGNGWCGGQARRLWSIGVMLPAWIVTVAAVRCISAQESIKDNAMVAMLVLCLITLVCLGWSVAPPPDPAPGDRLAFDRH